MIDDKRDKQRNDLNMTFINPHLNDIILYSCRKLLYICDT